jgi:hypothetical protein
VTSRLLILFSSDCLFFWILNHVRDCGCCALLPYRSGLHRGGCHKFVLGFGPYVPGVHDRRPSKPGAMEPNHPIYRSGDWRVDRYKCVAGRYEARARIRFHTPSVQAATRRAPAARRRYASR